MRLQILVGTDLCIQVWVTQRFLAIYFSTKRYNVNGTFLVQKRHYKRPKRDTVLNSRRRRKRKPFWSWNFTRPVKVDDQPFSSRFQYLQFPFKPLGNLGTRKFYDPVYSPIVLP